MESLRFEPGPQDLRMVGADESTELWRPHIVAIIVCANKVRPQANKASNCCYICCGIKIPCLKVLVSNRQFIRLRMFELCNNNEF